MRWWEAGRVVAGGGPGTSEISAGGSLALQAGVQAAVKKQNFFFSAKLLISQDIQIL